MEADDPRLLGQDERVEGVPLGEGLAGLDLAALGDEDLGAVGHLVVLDLAAAVVEDGDVGVPVDDDGRPVLVDDGLEVVELEDALVLGLELGFLGAAHGDAADVERPHGQLGAGLADRLGGDDAAGLAELDHLARGRAPPVAELADAALGFAGQDGADLDPFDAQVLEFLGDLLGDLRRSCRRSSRPESGLTTRSRATRPTIRSMKRLDDLAVLDDGRDVDPLERAAVVLVDDDLLADVDELPRQVAGVGRLEGRVGQALAGAVGRDEVLEDVQALPEVGDDGRLQDLARGLGHEAAHPGQLADLLLVAPGAGVGHDVERIELLALEADPCFISSIMAFETLSVTVPQISMTRLNRSPEEIVPSR